MSQEKSKKKYTNLGTVMVAKKYPDEAPDAPPRFYLKLEQSKDKNGNPLGDQVFPIKLANGAILESGDTLQMYCKRTKFKKAVADGKMSEEKAEELGSFLRYDVVLAEDADAVKGPKGSDDINF